MNNLFQLREEKNLSQEDVAQFLGVTRQAYSRYEREERELNYSSLIKLSKFFDVSIDYLLGNSTYFYPDRVNAENLKKDFYSSEERGIISDYRELNSAGQKLIKETIKTLLTSSVGSEQKKKI